MQKGIDSKAVLAIVIVLVAIAAFLILGRNSPTGQAVSQQDNQQIQTGQNTQPQQPADDVRLQLCTERSSGLSGQAKTDYISTCMDYLYKVCFSDSQCGPFRCVSNKCQ